MFDGLALFARSIATFADPATLGIIALASFVGIVIGALPGLTATMGVALMTTLTLKMQPNTALLVLVCTYVGAIYGGSRSAILLNIPGTPANAAACLDGFALAQRGEAGRAIGISTTGSVLGTLIGMFFLALATPALGEVALKFGAFEFFWLALFGVIISGNLTGDDPLKGWLVGFLGLALAAVGQDPIHAYERFAFGNRDLAGGFQLIPALVGAFGFAEVLTVLAEKTARAKIREFGSHLPRPGDVLKYWRTILRSGVIGTFIGIVPGRRRGRGVVVLVRRGQAREQGARPVRQGLGRRPDGGRDRRQRLRARARSSRCSRSRFPGSAPAAVLMAAMIIHGVQPGPLIMVNSPQFVYDVVAMMLYATIGIFVFGLLLVRPLLKVLQIPREIIMPIVFVLCVIGSYAISQRLFDVWTMLGFGVVGFVLRRYNYPMAPFVLGHRARRPPRQEPAARPGAVRRRPDAVLHPADQRGARRHLHRDDPDELRGGAAGAARLWAADAMAAARR